MTNPILDFPWTPRNVVADTVVKTGAGVLHSVVLNGMTVVGDVVLYDGVDATGVVIATFNFRSAVHVSYQGITFLFDCAIATGIFVDFASSTFAGNVTVMYM